MLVRQSDVKCVSVISVPGASSARGILHGRHLYDKTVIEVASEAGGEQSSSVSVAEGALRCSIDRGIVWRACAASITGRREGAVDE